MRMLAMVIMLAVAIVAMPERGASQQGDEVLRSLTKEIEALKEGQVRMQRELQEIKALLRRAREAPAPAEPQNVVFTLTDEPIKGDPGARLVLFDFTDYQ